MPMRRPLCLLSCLAALALAGQAATCLAESQLVVTSEFEGGSGVAVSIDQAARVIRLSPSPRPGRGWDCWWYVRVTGIEPGEPIVLEVGGGKGVWAQPMRAAYSEDGDTWLQTGDGKREGKWMRYEQRVTAQRAWFAWGPPFTPSDAAELVNGVAEAHPFAEAFTLCRTREGRPVPALRIREGERPDDQRRGVWIVARQHAWESGASWVCRGLVEWLVSPDERAASLRQRGEIVIVPIMDIDNTAIGAGGKQQNPHDHNRDWHDPPHWPAVAAAMRSIRAMNEAGRFDLYIDLHNPGPNDRQPFYFVAPDTLLSERGRRNLAWFVQDSKAHITGPMPLADNVRVSGANYDPQWQRISKNWVMANTADHAVAVTLETSWNTKDATTAGYMAVGRQQGMAVEQYLRRGVRE
jgi:hypothetical protein